MFPNWFYITFLVPIVLLGLIFVNFLMFRNSKDKLLLMPLGGFSLLFLQNILVYIPLSVAYSTQVIITKVLVSFIGYGLILTYYVLLLKKYPSLSKPVIAKTKKAKKVVKKKKR